MSKKDYYKILELSEEDKKLSGDEFNKILKKNFRELCKKWHPDKFANKSESEKKEAEEKFKEIAEAYDVLSSPDKRQKYEQFGSNEGFSFDFNGFGNTGMDDIDEMLNRFRGGFNPFTGDFGFGMGDMGGFQKNPASPQKPQPLKIKLRTTIEEIYNGKVKKIRYKRLTPCKDCDGSGLGKDGRVDICPVCGGTGMQIHTERHGWTTIQQTVPCEHCHGTGHSVVNPCKSCGGTGRVVTTEELDIHIPNGAVDGASFVLPGKGNYAQRSKDVVGDMVVILAVDPDEKFAIVNQYDLYTYVEVPILDCITGTKVELKLFNDKKVSVEVPKFAKEGKVLRVSGYGMPKNFGRGNLLIEIKHKFPKDISRSDEKLIKELKESKNFK